MTNFIDFTKTVNISYLSNLAMQATKKHNVYLSDFKNYVSERNRLILNYTTEDVIHSIYECMDIENPINCPTLLQSYLSELPLRDLHEMHRQAVVIVDYKSVINNSPSMTIVECVAAFKKYLMVFIFALTSVAAFSQHTVDLTKPFNEKVSDYYRDCNLHEVTILKLFENQIWLDYDIDYEFRKGDLINIINGIFILPPSFRKSIITVIENPDNWDLNDGNFIKG